MKPSTTEWLPILEGEDAMRAQDIIEHVCSEVSTQIDVLCERPGDATFVGGTAGLALFVAYARRWRRNILNEHVLYRLLKHAIQSQDGREPGASFYFGAVGPGWVAEHLKCDLGKRDIGHTCDELDDVLCGGITAAGGWMYRHELFRGLTGLGVYLLERPPSETVTLGLSEITDALLRSATRPRSDLLTWWTDPNMISNPHTPSRQPYHNLGVPHGVMGPIVVLARLAQRDGTLTDHCVAAIRWLLEQQASSHFPCFGMVANHVPHVPWLPVAWCYGDLGVAGTLANSARVLERRDWLDAAQGIGREAARAQVAAEGTSLCHGSAGNAHVFARLYQYTRDDVFRHAAREWYRLLMRQWNPHGGGFAGFRASGVRALNSSGFLRGAGGAALSLLAGISDVDPQWDRVMLLSA